jgi:hypothetical protein
MWFCKGSNSECIKELHQISSDDASFLSRDITGDENLIYGYDPETKQQSSQWKSPNSLRLTKVRQVKSKVKSTLIIFFAIKGVLYKEFILAGRTVSSAHCYEVLWRLCEHLRRHHAQLRRQRNWLLHHDNMQTHTSFFPWEFWQKTTWLSYPTHQWCWAPSHNVTSRMHLKHGISAGNGAYMWKGTALRVMVASRPKVNFWPNGSTSHENYGPEWYHHSIAMAVL